MDADAVLKRFNNTTSIQDEDSELGQHGDSDSWRELRKVFDAAVANKAQVEARRLAASFHSLQTQNELLHHENDGLTGALDTKKKRKKKSNTMDLQQREEYHSSAVFWSPRKLREGRAREAVKQKDAEQLQLQKTRDRELKATATAHKKQQAEVAKESRQRAKEEREVAKKARVENLAAARALKKQQRDTATSQKSRDTLNKGKRAASRSSSKAPTKRRRVVVVA